MAITWTSKRKEPLGDRYVITGYTSSVSSSGDSFTPGALGLTRIDSIMGVSAQGGTYAIQAVPNSNDGTLDSSSGSLYLAPATTSILNVTVLGK